MTIYLEPISTNPDINGFFITEKEATYAVREKSSNNFLEIVVKDVNQRLSNDTGYVPIGSSFIEYPNVNGLYMSLSYHNAIVTEVYDTYKDEVVDPTEYTVVDNKIFPIVNGQRWIGEEGRYKVSYTAGVNNPPYGLQIIGLSLVSELYKIGQTDPEPIDFSIYEKLISEYRIIL